MARLSEMNDDEAGAALLKAYRGACDAYDPEEHGDHPSHAVASWMKNARDAKAKDEGGLGPVEIENKRKPGADGEGEVMPTNPNGEDDDQPELTAGGNNGNGGAVPAQDGRYGVDSAGVPRFERMNAKGETVGVVVGDAAIVAHSRQSNPARVRRLALAIPGYSRLK
jgi:hypothetical protein